MEITKTVSASLAALVLASQLPMAAALADEPQEGKPVIYYNVFGDEVYQPDRSIEDCLDGLDPTEYSHELSLMLLCIAGASKSDLGVPIETDAEKKDSHIYKSLDSLGFEDIEMYNYYADPMDARYGEDNAAYTVAHKKLKNGREMLLAVVRGSFGRFSTGKDASPDWASNMNLFINDAGNHNGFAVAASKVKQGIDSYADAKGLGDAVYVLTGHSRGAAIANLMSKEYIDGGMPVSDLYSYAFGCPNVTVNTGEAGFYKNLFSVCNSKDLVTLIPPESLGETRYGTTLWFSEHSRGYDSAAQDEEMKEFIENLGLPSDAEMAAHDVREYLNVTAGFASADDFTTVCYPTVECSPVGDDLYTFTGETKDGISLDTASVWSVSITPGTEPITSINIQFTDAYEEDHINEKAVFNTPAIKEGTVVVGAVANHVSDELSYLAAIVNGRWLKARTVQ